MAEFSLVPKVSQWGKKPVQEKTVLDEDGRPVRRKPITKKDLTEQAVKDNLLDTKILQKHLIMLENHKNRRLHQIDREVVETQRFLERLAAEKQSLRERRESAAEFGYSHVLQQILKSMGLPTEAPKFKPPIQQNKSGGRRTGSGSKRGSATPASLVASQGRKSSAPASLRGVSAAHLTPPAANHQFEDTIPGKNEIGLDFDLESESTARTNERDDVSDDTSIRLPDDDDDGAADGNDARKSKSENKKVTFVGVGNESDANDDSVTEIANAANSARDQVVDDTHLPWELRRLRWELARRDQPKSPEFQSPAILKWKQILQEKKKCPVPECTLHGERYSQLKRRGDSVGKRLSSAAVQSLNSHFYHYDDGRPYQSTDSTRFPSLSPRWKSANSDPSRQSETPGTTFSSPSPNIFRDLDSEEEEDDDEANTDLGSVDAISSVRRPMRGSNREKMAVYKEASLRNAFEIMRKRVASEVPEPFNKNYGDPTPNWKILNPLKLRLRIFHKSPLYVKWKM